MRPGRAPRSRRLVWLAALVVLAVAAVVLQGSSLPHTHSAAGLHNQEHDFSLLATLGAGALPAGAFEVLLILVVVAAVRATPRARRARLPRLAASRAPPLS